MKNWMEWCNRNQPIIAFGIHVIKNKHMEHRSSQNSVTIIIHPFSHPCVHLSFHFHPDFPLPGHFLQLFQDDSKAFLGQPSDTVAPACPGSSPGSSPGGTCPRHLPRETARGHLIQIPEQPQLAPLYVEEQRLYSKHLLGERASHPISKGALLHPAAWLLVF